MRIRSLKLNDDKFAIIIDNAPEHLLTSNVSGDIKKKSGASMVVISPDEVELDAIGYSGCGVQEVNDASTTDGQS